MPEAQGSWAGQSHPTLHRQGIDFSHRGKQHIPRVRGDTWKNNPHPLISKHVERMQSFSFSSFSLQRRIQDGGQHRPPSEGVPGGGVRGLGTETLLKYSTIIKDLGGQRTSAPEISL